MCHNSLCYHFISYWNRIIVFPVRLDIRKIICSTYYQPIMLGSGGIKAVSDHEDEQPRAGWGKLGHRAANPLKRVKKGEGTAMRHEN